MTTENPSRRRVVAAALAAGAALNTLAISRPRAATIERQASVTVTTGSATEQTILAAIERHRAAFAEQMRASRTRSGTVDAKWSPNYDAEALEKADIADNEAHRKARACAKALLRLQPATVAGVLALLSYVTEFNAGGVGLDDGDPDWKSDPHMWPNDIKYRAAELDEDSANFPWILLDRVRRMLSNLPRHEVA